MLGAAHHLLRALGVLLVLAPVASAQRAQITQEIFTRQGLPSLVANPVPNGNEGDVVAWRACPPLGACVPVPLDAPDDRSIKPGDVVAGTRFEVDVRARNGVLTSDRSQPWLGRVRATARPGVGGTPRVGRIARVVRADWAGGWADDRSLLRLEACRTAAGKDCETVSAQGEDLPVCPGAAAVLGRRYEGWWIRSVDQRISRDSAFAGVGYDRPRDIPIARPFPTTVRSKLVGPARPRGRGRFAECLKPRIGFPRRAESVDGRLILAHVACASACEFELVVRDDRRTIRRRGEVSPDRLGLADDVRLVGTSVHVRVVVNGRHRASGTVELG